MTLHRHDHALPRLFCLLSSSDRTDLVAALARVGVGGFQVRDKRASTRDLVALTREVRHAAGPGAVVVVDDRLDVALAAGADGVHLGADDLDVADARRLAPHLMIGATCRDRAQVVAAAAAGATYAGLGPVRATASKAGLPAALGLDGVRAATGVLPIIAIGGLEAPDVADVRRAGAHGVAVIGAIWRPPDPVAAAKELVTAVG